ncbi:hypothetical protein [Citreimonas salinaria]|uniref:Uncharacterized protein n=1 Tax=Citreimonas salinaria TaxID=321339 RepID=A0A1H3MGW6_9RHOB|nr:hypothetical protein [Citreimonas salinaria]SDY75932.1 hypothetical protein SAMN05444340_11722 [Citreimonas salinaria]
MNEKMNDPSHRAYQVLALLRCAMLAEENETSGLDWKATATVLGLAEELMASVIDGIELHEKAKRKDAA